MSLDELASQSPYGRFLEHCALGELAFQVSRSGKALIYPRLIDPESGEAPQWAISKGRGVVHAVTVVHQKDQQPFALALIDLDEGFRMMSRVDTDSPANIAIGTRVTVGFRSLAEGQPALPVFTAEGTRP